MLFACLQVSSQEGQQDSSSQFHSPRTPVALNVITNKAVVSGLMKRSIFSLALGRWLS